MLERSGEIDGTEEPKELYVTLPLRGGAATFKGKKPVEVDFGSYTVMTITWKKVVETVFKDVVKSNEKKLALYEMSGRVNGKTRSILASDDTEMKSSIKIAENLYFEAHYDTESLLRIMTERILEPIGYNYSGINITVRND